ncbi:hypothetical protein [Pseudomonas rhizoryzae]|uniref:hypothetical protein n=1 Tax=Pseudomonas rhizoryzae TaxID=2571129 RepID=UPI0010C22903|nr:hypothetical protein [Pseudomonas rhizoryzae]
MKIVAAALGLLISASAFAGIGQNIDTIDGWSVHLSSDSMTDKKTCTAVYIKNRGVQYTFDSFAIGDLSWPTSYRYRFDDGKASPTIDTTDVERKIGAVVIMDPKFLEQLLTSKRVRIQVLANGNRQLDYDVDVSQLPSVNEFLKSPRCN